MTEKNTNSFDDFNSENSDNLSQKMFIKAKINNFLSEDDKRTSSEDTSLLDNKKRNWLGSKKIEVEYSPEISVFDVAAYIIKKLGPMSTMKLQKLVYYSQAWSLVWDEKPLFKEKIEAWANGPVVRDLFYFHRGQFLISSIPIGNPDLLSEEQKETIDAVLDFYGNKPAQWLIDLSHKEKPWQEARKGLPLNASSSRIITLDSIADYYSSINDQQENEKETTKD